MGNPLVTLSDFKAYKKITKTEDDVKLSLIIESANKLAKTYCRRTFVDYVSSDKVEYFNGNEYSTVLLSEFPVISITSVEIASDGVTYTALTEDEDYFVDYELDAIHTPYQLPFTSGAAPAFKSVKVTYRGGFAEVPEDLRIAVLDLVEYYRQEEYTPRKSMDGSTIENLGFREGGGSSLPSHIKRVFEMYRVF
jgi:hypothetical protein